MTRTNIAIDDDACQSLMDRFNLETKRDAVDLALRRLAAESLDLGEADASVVIRTTAADYEAAVAIKVGAEVLHADADFSVQARHTELETHPASVR